MSSSSSPPPPKSSSWKKTAALAASYAMAADNRLKEPVVFKFKVGSIALKALNRKPSKSKTLKKRTKIYETGYKGAQLMDKIRLKIARAFWAHTSRQGKDVTPLHDFLNNHPEEQPFFLLTMMSIHERTATGGETISASIIEDHSNYIDIMNTLQAEGDKISKDKVESLQAFANVIYNRTLEARTKVDAILSLEKEAWDDLTVSGVVAKIWEVSAVVDKAREDFKTTSAIASSSSSTTTTIVPSTSSPPSVVAGTTTIPVPASVAKPDTPAATSVATTSTISTITTTQTTTTTATTVEEEEEEEETPSLPWDVFCQSIAPSYTEEGYEPAVELSTEHYTKVKVRPQLVKLDGPTKPGVLFCTTCDKDIYESSAYYNCRPCHKHQICDNKECAIAHHCKIRKPRGFCICGKDAVFWCERCQDTFYCGPTCQSKDWHHHKRVCQPPLRN